MPSTPAAGSESGLEQAPREALVEDLERRIAEIEALDDDAIGHFTRWDWLWCVLGAVVVPALAMWWFAE